MGTITRIDYNRERKRYYVYVDGQYCTSVRERTFRALQISEGMQISCEKVKELESFHWKQKYGEKAWKKEQVRLDRVTELLCSIDSRIKVKKVGFGADNATFISSHPYVSGSPDLSLVLSNHESIQILMVEVTGTEFRRGDDYWVRPDKLEFCRKNPKKDIWIILHYREPMELFVFLKPDNSKHYEHKEFEIGESIEYFVVFSDTSPEVIEAERFSKYLIAKIDKVNQQI